MLPPWLNWKTFLIVTVILFIAGTITYSNHLATKIGADEQRKIEQWAEAVKLNASGSSFDVNLTARILTENSIDIPILLLTEKDSLLDYRNIDSAKLHTDKSYLPLLIQSYNKLHEPIIWKNPLDSTQTNKVYYGESALLKQVRYYPIVQLIIAGLFIVVIVITQYNNYKSTQNQVWAGLAKETAHQLGTPVSSLQGWIEMLREVPGNESIVPEIEKDTQRLLLITDRFGKIGSQPSLEEKNIVQQVQTMVDYIKKRAGQKVVFTLQYSDADITGLISPPLFDWVIENLLKNALDAMDGKGNIEVTIKEDATSIFIYLSDSGKGISKQHITKVFKPGFTTKKRGWGLGLTLTKRIVEQYHKGRIFIASSEVGKGTTFCVTLPKTN